MTDFTEDRPLSLTDAAAFLHLGYEATKQLFDSGELPAVSLNQKHYVVMRSDLVDFVRTQGREQAKQRKAAKPGTPASALKAAASQRRRRGQQMPDLTQYERPSNAAGK